MALALTVLLVHLLVGHGFHGELGLWDPGDGRWAIQVQLGFYLTQELFAASDYRRAVPGLTLATELAPGSSFLLYNLACAQARSGLPDGALASLERALDHGLAQPSQIATDADLVSLRDRPEFARLLARARELEAAATTSPAPQ